MRRNTLVGGLVVVVCGLVAMKSLGGSTVAAKAFAELPKTAPGEYCSVYGKLDANSVQHLDGATVVRFNLVEEKTDRRLEVIYQNRNSALPANFAQASHAKVSGTYDPANRVFTGNSVTTKCPSKYDAGTPTYR